MANDVLIGATNQFNFPELPNGVFDHIGNAFYLVDDIKIEKVILSCGEINDLEISLIEKLKNRRIAYSKEMDSTYEMIYGTWHFLDTINYDNENDNSLVTYLKYYDYTFLFMGDVLSVVENNIIKKYQLSKIDFLKMGHHGSKTSSGKKFINYIKPGYDLISVGRKNKYGHPNKETLENLKGFIIYRTDLIGTIKLIINKNKVFFENYSP